MATKKENIVKCVNTVNVRHKRQPQHVVPSAEGCEERVYRPARRLGRLIRNEMIDGVRSNAARLLQNQYDDAFGPVDPLSNIHTDRFELADALMRDGRKSMAETTKDMAKVESSE